MLRQRILSVRAIHSWEKIMKKAKRESGEYPGIRSAKNNVNWSVTNQSIGSVGFCFSNR